MNKIKEITEQTVAAEKEKKIDICRQVFYSVAEIRAGGDNGVKKGREAKYWIYKRTRLNIIIYSWKVVDGWEGMWEGRGLRTLEEMVSFFYFNMFLTVVLDKKTE